MYITIKKCKHVHEICIFSIIVNEKLDRTLILSYLEHFSQRT